MMQTDILGDRTLHVWAHATGRSLNLEVLVYMSRIPMCWESSTVVIARITRDERTTTLSCEISQTSCICIHRIRAKSRVNN